MIKRQNSFIIQSMEPEKALSLEQYANDYKIHYKLGDGGQANVYLASKNHQLYAIKAYLPGPSKDAGYSVEAEFLSRLKHPNLINLVGHDQKATIKLDQMPPERRAMVVLELAQGGQLFDYISKQGKFTPEVSRYYAKQIVSAIKYLDKEGITHRDLKPQNILLDSHYNIKITDFGLSRYAKGDSGDYRLRSRVGTEGYRPPEMEEGKYTGVQADMFAAGVVLFMMYTGGPPFFSAKSHDRVYKHIRERNFTKFWQMHEKGKPQGFFSSSFKKLLNSFFSSDPSLRPTFDSLEDDQWWNGQDISQIQLQQYMKPRAVVLYENSQINQIRKQLFKNKIKEEEQCLEIESSDTRCECEDETQESTRQEVFFKTYKSLTIKTEDLPKYTNPKLPYSKEDPAFVVAWVKDVLADLFKNYVGEITPQSFSMSYNPTTHQIDANLEFLIDEEEEVSLDLAGQLHWSEKEGVGVDWKKKRGNVYWLAAIESRLVSQLSKLN